MGSRARRHGAARRGCLGDGPFLAAPPMSVDELPLAALVALFGGAAAVVWVAGIHLSDTTDVLSARLGLGEALGGLLLLAVATNLPARNLVRVPRQLPAEHSAGAVPRAPP